MGVSIKDLDSLERSFDEASRSVGSPSDLELVRRDWLSKEGTLRALFAQLKEVDPAEKPKVAARLNELKSKVEGFVEDFAKNAALKAQSEKLKQEYLDFSLPARNLGLGNNHPISRMEQRIMDILRPFGFQSVLGPEVETEYYCFDALQILAHHPARDMQDTFYTESGFVLRTHTTSVQTRTLEKGELPIKIATFGRAYRNETEDASHQAMFHQFEVAWVEEGLTLSHLLGLLSHILKELFGKRRKIRFVPKYYPYTEPSVGPQVDCILCRGQGCPSCGGAGWVTVGGSGMIHPAVLREFKLDPSKIGGLAFGLGTSRLAAQMFEMPRMKMLYENDLRVLKDVA